MALQSNQTLNSAISKAHNFLYYDGVELEYTQWTSAITANATHYLYKINDDGTGEVYTTGDTAPKLDESDLAISFNIVPNAVGSASTTFSTTSNASAEVTAIATFTVTSLFDFVKKDDYTDDMKNKIMGQYK